MNKTALITGCIFCGLSIALGAFGTHAIADWVTHDRLETWQTASRYLMNHGLALFSLGVLSKLISKPMAVSSWLFISGTLIFCLSLFTIVLLDITWLGAFAPVGGILTMAGWLTLMISLIKSF